MNDKKFNDMKKTYNSPTVQLFTVRTAHVMAVSNPEVTVSTTGSVNAEQVEVRRSGRNVWSEEW